MKKILYLILTIILITFSQSGAQSTEWARAFNGPGYEVGRKVCTDASDNVYVLSTFQGTVDFDPGAGITNLTADAAGDLAITKLDANGDFVWAKHLSGTYANTMEFGMEIDANGNVFIASALEGTGDLDPGTGTQAFTASGTADIFLLKLDANGDFVWGHHLIGSGFERATSLALDPSGNVLITGYFETTIDFDPGNGTTNLVPPNMANAFIAKYDGSGALVWAHAFGGQEGYEVISDVFGNAYVTGVYTGANDFDPGTGTQTLPHVSSYDAFVAKFDPWGDFVYAKGFTGANQIIPYGIITDGGQGVYVTGSFMSTADFDPGNGTQNLTSIGNEDIFLAKLDAYGDLDWVHQIGGTDQEFALSVDIDILGNPYIAGTFRGTVDFDPGSGVQSLVSNANQVSFNIFLAKYSKLGVYQWAEKYGGSDSNWGHEVHIGQDGSIYSVGQFYGNNSEFGFGGTSYTLNSNSVDIYVQKIKQVVTDRSDELGNSEFSIFPNPAQNQLNIESDQVLLQARIYSMNGQILEQKEALSNSLNISMLFPGIYILELSTREGIFRQKFIKN